MNLLTIASPRPRQLCILLTGLLLTATAYAQAPVVVSRQPAANAVAASGTSAVVVGFSSPQLATTSVRVVGDRYAGRRLGSPVVVGNTSSLTPVPAFGAGELVRVSVPSTGAGISPQVYEFRAGTGRASATFGPRQTLAVGIQPSAVAPGDFDGDGDLDLAVSNLGTGGNSGTGLVYVYQNNGQGIFTQTSNLLYAKLGQQVVSVVLPKNWTVKAG